MNESSIPQEFESSNPPVVVGESAKHPVTPASYIDIHHLTMTKGGGTFTFSLFLKVIAR